MRILIYTWATGIGDGIMNSGYVRELKLKYPEAEIDIFASKFYTLSYKNNPYVKKIYNLLYYKRKFIKSTLLHLPLLLELRKNSYDIVFDTTSSYQKLNFRILKIINGKQTIGIYKSNNRYGYERKYLEKIYDKLYEQWGIIGEILGEKETPKYDFFLAPQKENKAKEFWSKVEKNRKKIIFNGEGGGGKQLSDSKIIETLKSICKNEDYEVAVITTPESRKRFKRLIDMIEVRNLRLSYETDIFDAGALIKESDLLVSLDTSLIHIASAVGTKIVGIYANANHIIENFSPKFVDYLIVTQKEKSRNDRELENYSINEVLESIEKII